MGTSKGTKEQVDRAAARILPGVDAATRYEKTHQDAMVETKVIAIALMEVNHLEGPAEEVELMAEMRDESICPWTELMIRGETEMDRVAGTEIKTN